MSSHFVLGLPIASNGFNNTNSNIITPSTNASVVKATPPSEDKYAALKDLDEQFKEIKMGGTTNGVPTAAVVDPFNTATVGQPAVVTSNPNNPFKNAFALTNGGGFNGTAGVVAPAAASPWTVTTEVNGNNDASGMGPKAPMTNGWSNSFQSNGFGAFNSTSGSLFDLNGFGTMTTTGPTNGFGSNGFQNGFGRPAINGNANPFAVSLIFRHI